MVEIFLSAMMCVGCYVNWEKYQKSFSTALLLFLAGVWADIGFNSVMRRFHEGQAIITRYDLLIIIIMAVVWIGGVKLRKLSKIP